MVLEIRYSYAVRFRALSEIVDIHALRSRSARLRRRDVDTCFARLSIIRFQIIFCTCYILVCSGDCLALR